jgi:hypothetical protein
MPAELSTTIGNISSMLCETKTAQVPNYTLGQETTNNKKLNNDIKLILL